MHKVKKISILTCRQLLEIFRCFSVSILTAIFSGEPGLAGFIAPKDDGGGGDNWSCETRKAPFKSSPPTNQHPIFIKGWMPFLLPSHVEALKGK